MPTVGIDIGHSESTWELKGSKGIKTNLHPSGHFEEHWFNAEVSVRASEILERHGVKVVMAQKPYDNHEVSLRERTDFYDAHNCDVIVSNHANAGVKSANGFCVFYWYNSEDAKKLAQIILKHSKVLPINQFGNGAIASVPKTWTDFHMCREPEAVSPLIEWGFFTNENDLKLILDPEFRRQCAEVEANAILEYLNIPYMEIKSVNNVTIEQPLWNGVPVKDGQIGRLIIYKPINLWKDDSEGKLEMVKVLQPNETYRVYGYRDDHGGQYAVGGGYWVTKMNDYIKYETPSKRVLKQAREYFSNK